MSSSENPTKPSLSIGYVTASPEEIRVSLERLSPQEIRTSQETPQAMVGISVSTLDESNYVRLKIAIRDVLMANELQGLMDGSCPRPSTRNTPEDYAWTSRDAKARCLIRQSLPSEVFLHTQNCETASEILDCITRLREPKSANVIQGLRLELHGMVWEKDDNVTSFWSRLMSVVNRIRATGKDVDSSEIITKVLVSLPRKFATFRANWEYNSTADSTIGEFKEKLMTAELSLAQTERSETQEMAFQAQAADSGSVDTAVEGALVANNKHSSKGGRCPSCHNMLVCPHCLYSNTVKKVENKNKTDGRFDGRCYNCGKRGHRATECRGDTKKLNKDPVVYAGVSSLLSVKD
jgi:hypothetical protein